MNATRNVHPFYGAVCLFLLLPFCAFSQSPGGVSGQEFWYGEKDSSAIISNYHSIDLLNMSSGARDSITDIPVSSSLFFVVQGNFPAALEDTCFQIGDVTVTDGGVYHGGGFTPIDFTDSVAKIISVQTIRGHRMAKDTAPEVKTGNLSKFSVAEVIYYPFVLDRAERRMVNSYLSLKYAIPILEGISHQWKDYWKKDSTHYWDVNKDKAYYVRIMGLGSDKAQNFHQTQSIAETGDHFQLSLDTTQPSGAMPRAWIAQEGFVIFSERTIRPGFSYGYCSGVRSGKNPLARWKFKASSNWRTNASRILIEAKKPNGNVADSIFYTDGTNYYHAPWVYQDADVIRYEAALSNIQVGKNYTFTKRSSASQGCGDVVVSSNGSGLNVFNAGGITGNLQVHSFETGVTYESDLGALEQMNLPKGQYHVVVSDDENREVYNEMVAVTDTEVDNSPSSTLDLPVMTLFPNPVLSGSKVTLELDRFQPDDYHWQLVDAQGRIIREEPLHIEGRHTVVFEAPSVGTYTIRVLSKSGTYSLKLIVASH